MSYPISEPEDFRGMECSSCGKRKLSVSSRPDAFAREIGGNPDAYHTVCDYCDQQNREDI